MSLESASSIQKVESDDSIVACQLDAADFFDSIDPKPTSDRHLRDGSRMKARAKALRPLPECGFLSSASGCSCIQRRSSNQR
jgi:hypothetical protein